MPKIKNHIELNNVFDYAHMKVLDALNRFTRKCFNEKTIDSGVFDKYSLTIKVKSFIDMSEYFLVKTEIIGDIFGKSYLLINAESMEHLAPTFHGANGDKQFALEMLKELDNILSATLISSLSNHYHLKIYGDVPELVTPPIQKELSEYIYSDFDKVKGKLFFYALEFSLPEIPTAKCIFCWCIEYKFFEEKS